MPVTRLGSGTLAGMVYGSYALAYNGSTLNGFLSATASGSDSFSYSGTESATAFESGSVTRGTHLAGSFANGCFNLGSVVLSDEGDIHACYQYCYSQTAAESGNSAGTFSAAVSWSSSDPHYSGAGSATAGGAGSSSYSGAAGETTLRQQG